MSNTFRPSPPKPPAPVKPPPLVHQGRPMAGSIQIPTYITPVEAYALQTAAAGRRRFLEVGAAHGFSTVLLAQAGELVISVDPHTDYGTWEVFLGNLERHGVLERVTPRRGRSEDELPKMLSWGGAGFFDLAFIDGSHAEVDADLDLRWAKVLVRVGGIIAVHDYSVRWPGVLTAVDRQLRGLDGWRVQSMYLAVNE